MDLTQIRYFLTLATTLNFTRAAEMCHVTQPALTKSIQKLEDELGGPLILRERRDTQLTELGRTMLPLLQHVFDAADAARRGAQDFHRQDIERLRIGLGAWVAADSILPILRELHHRFTGLTISVQSADTGTLNDWLIGAQIDVALTADPHALTERANVWPLFRDDWVAVFAATHRLAQGGPISGHELQTQECVARDGQAGAMPNLAGLTLQPRHIAATDDHLWLLLRSSQGVALSTARHNLPADMTRRRLHPPGGPLIHLVTIPGRRAPRAVDTFVRLARARDWSEESVAA